MKTSTRKRLQKQLDNLIPNYPPFKLGYKIPRDDRDPDHYSDLCVTLDWILSHAFFDSIITEQHNCETYMIIYIDFKKAVKILEFLPFYSQDDETVGQIIECQKFFIEHDDFNADINKKCVNEWVHKRIEFIDYKMKISEKEMFKYVNQALGRYGGA